MKLDIEVNKFVLEEYRTLRKEIEGTGSTIENRKKQAFGVTMGTALLLYTGIIPVIAKYVGASDTGKYNINQYAVIIALGACLLTTVLFWEGITLARHANRIGIYIRRLEDYVYRPWCCTEDTLGWEKSLRMKTKEVVSRSEECNSDKESKKLRQVLRPKGSQKRSFIEKTRNVGFFVLLLIFNLIILFHQNHINKMETLKALWDWFSQNLINKMEILKALWDWFSRLCH